MASETVTVLAPVTLVQKEKSWPYPAEKDGWVASHNALRLDMSDFQRAIDALVGHIEGDSGLQAWQVDTLQAWWKRFSFDVHEHHAHEEDIAFPAVEKRVKLPPKMSTDHEGLLSQMQAIGNLINDLTAGNAAQGKAAVQDIQAKFAAFRTFMEEHLKEEEDIGLPLLRCNFSFEEWAPVEKLIIKEAQKDALSIGQFMRPMNDEEKLEFMKYAGMPGFVQKLIILPRCAKFERMYAARLEEIVQNKHAEPKPSLFSRIFLFWR